VGTGKAAKQVSLEKASRAERNCFVIRGVHRSVAEVLIVLPAVVFCFPFSELQFGTDAARIFALISRSKQNPNGFKEQSVDY
jgi:hypothetical protein